jgi:hypothetical protein
VDLDHRQVRAAAMIATACSRLRDFDGRPSWPLGVSTKVATLLAAAFLAVTAAAERTRQPGPDGQIPLTRNEISRLLTPMITQPARPAVRLRWSTWHRRHQYRARTSHYQRQAATEQ